MKLSELPGNPDNPGFIFFPEIIELQELDEPVHIGDCARLHRVNAAHKAELRQALDPYVQLRRFGNVNPWEYTEVPADGGGIGFERILDSDAHQFWVVSNWRKLADLPLQLALELADPSLTPFLTRMNPGISSSGQVNSHAIFNWLGENLLAKRRKVTVAHVHGIEKAFALLVNFEINTDPNYGFIQKAIDDFADLKMIAWRRPLYVVGLFAIIESLLTTEQKGKSLSYQLREKVSEVNSKFHCPLVLSDYFGALAQGDLKDLVKKMYQYRSDIAHGNVVDIGKTPSVQLNHDAVCNFLHTLVRRLILLALEQPALVRGLKAS